MRITTEINHLLVEQSPYTTFPENFSQICL